MIILTYLFTGLRLSELANLTWDRVDLDTAFITVVRGKGRRDRVIPIHDRLLEELRLWSRHSPTLSSSHAVAERYRTKGYPKCFGASSKGGWGSNALLTSSGIASRPSCAGVERICERFNTC
jgi:integrase